MLAGTLAIYAWLPRRYSASASVWLGSRAEPERGGISDAAFRDEEIRVLVSPVASAVADVLASPATRDIDRHYALAEQAGRYAGDAVKVHPVGGSRAVIISVSAPDPALAAAIVNRLVDRYTALRRDGRAWEQRLERLRYEARVAHDGMIRAQTAANSRRTAIRPNGARDNVERRQSDGATGPAQPGDEIIGRALAALGEQRTQLGADLTKLQERYGPLHPDIIAISARISAVEDEIASETRRADALAARARAARTRVDEQIKRSDEAAQRGVRLDASAVAAGNRYRALLENVRGLEAAKPAIGNAHVIARAEVPAAPDFPRPWPFAVAGVLAALAAGGAVALVREARVPGFRTRAAAERLLGLPVIGMVPDMSEITGGRESGIDPRDLVLSHDQPSFTGALNAIRVGLGVTAGAHRAKSVAISSAVAGEGKTTVSIGLARSAALAGLRVLLVDCDVRLPAASRALAPQSGTALTDVLGGKIAFEHALTRDTASGAWVLATCRDEPAAAAGIVGSDAMGRLLARVAGDYDLIVLDAAPVLALAETAALARLADSVLLVARWRTTPIGATRLALDMLREAGAPVSGLALTWVST